MTITDELSHIVGDAFADAGLSVEYGLVRVSDRPDLAQFQCNGALAAAKAHKRNPRAIGEAIAEKLSANRLFADVSVAGPGFVNLTLADDSLAERVAVMGAEEGVGGWRRSQPETIVLDYGGPNVAKPLHVGHLRSAIIGESLKRVCRFVGDHAIADIHLGDWGLQMGQLVSELELRQPDLPYFDDAADVFPQEPPVTLAALEELYPVASAACKADPDRAALARVATKKLQDGHPGYRALWRSFVDLSVAAMRENYADLGVRFDLWNGEADVDPLIAPMVADLKAKGLAESSEGALVIRVARDGDRKDMPPLMLVNSQGAVGYHATDMATIIDRRATLAPDRILYVVDNRQALHFEQVFRAVALADIFDEDRLEHLGFGTMQGKDGKPFKTREGGVLKLRDLIDHVTERAAARLVEGGLAADLDTTARTQAARLVGVAALKFADLSNQRITDYIFDLDRFLAFEGKTGPYLLYAAVRAKALLRRASRAGVGEEGPLMIGGAEERDLALTLLAFGDAVRAAYKNRMPHHLCEHGFALAQTFSKFYSARRIIDEPDAALRASRLAFVRITGAQLSIVLDLLGLEAPEQM